MTHPLIALAPEVSQALAAGRPVVALESTIISHGMPYPRNVEMAREVEGIIREGGVHHEIGATGRYPGVRHGRLGWGAPWW